MTDFLIKIKHIAKKTADLWLQFENGSGDISQKRLLNKQPDAGFCTHEVRVKTIIYKGTHPLERVEHVDRSKLANEVLLAIFMIILLSM